MAIWAPIPRVPPVTRAVRFSREKMDGIDILSVFCLTVCVVCKHWTGLIGNWQYEKEAKY
jgi:hypothetical protein